MDKAIDDHSAAIERLHERYVQLHVEANHVQLMITYLSEKGLRERYAALWRENARLRQTISGEDVPRG